MIRLPGSIEYDEVPLEKRYRAATRALSARIGALYRRAVDEFGDEALDLIRSVSWAHGRELAASLSQEEPPLDAARAALQLARLLDLLGIEGEVAEISSERARIRIDACPYGVSDPRLCEARISLESGFVRALGGDLEVEKCSARGDPVCQFRIERTR